MELESSNSTTSAAHAVLGLQPAAAVSIALRTFGEQVMPEDVITECVASSLSTEFGQGDSQNVATSMVKLFLNDDGVNPRILACGVSLLSSLSPPDKLRLIFSSCDSDADGMISVEELGLIVKAYNYIVLALVQLFIDGAVDAMAGGQDDKAQLLNEVMPVLNGAIASMSRDARELCSTFGMTFMDFSGWCSANFCMSAWINRLAAVWSPKLLALRSASPAELEKTLADLPKEDAPLMQALDQLLSCVPEVKPASLRDRLVSMTEQHAVKKPCVVMTLLLLSEDVTPSEFLTATLHRCTGDGVADVPDAMLQSMASCILTIGEEVGSVLVACLSMMLTGQSRSSAIPRDFILRGLSARISDLASSTVPQSRDNAESGTPISASSLQDAWMQNIRLQQWIASLQQFWPHVVRLYSHAFNSALRNRSQKHRPARTLSSDIQASAEDGAARKIQAAARRTNSRKQYRSSLKAAMRVQTIWRMHQSKAVALRLRQQKETQTDWEAQHKRRMQRLQNNERQLQTLKQVPAAQVLRWSIARRHGSIAAIQALYRGRRVRKQLPAARMNHQRNVSAAKIQGLTRKWLTGRSTEGKTALQNGRPPLQPRAINQMTIETRQRLQQLIANRREKRAHPSSIVELRKRVQSELGAHALKYSSGCQASFRRQQLSESIPAKVRLLMNAPQLGELCEDMVSTLYFAFPPPPACRFEASRESHVAFRTRTSVPTTANSMNKDPLGDTPLASQPSSPQNYLPKVSTATREELQRERDALLSSLGAS
eukprot:SAG31_NODE_481_length_15082_cov_13.818728_3_plen_771_part_00